MRGPKRKGVRYFGPYSHAWAIRETLDLLLRVFPARTCSAGVFKRAGQVGRPCLLGYIGKCSAPCVGRVDAAAHRAIVDDFCDFMAGQTGPFLRRLEKQMQVAAANQDYEKAARLRDDIKALERAVEKQAVVLGDGTDADVIALAEDPLEAAVQIFYVRGGRVRGQRGWVVDKVEDLSTAELVERFLLQLYGTENGDAWNDSVPREVLVPALPEDAETVSAWLRECRGSNVDLRVPQRGEKRALMETVARNAAHSLALHKTKRGSDLTTRSQALAEIQEALALDEAPLRIECYDVSHIQETDVVASMVVFEDGLARKSEYRRFVIRGLAGRGDTASIHEVITRRFRRYLDERSTTGELDGEDVGEHGAASDLPAGIDPETGRPRRFAYAPNLVVVDGGAPQVAAARQALDALGVDDVALCGLAKRLEEVWLPDDAHPVVLPRTSEGLYLLQRVRDEAHRFAIAHHRSRRSKSMTASALDGVPGLGESRRKALLKHFGSLKRLTAASVEEIIEVPGIGRHTAAAVVSALASGDRARGFAVNTATGEILDDQQQDEGSVTAP
jgi:excinuclease ABC subunit C